MSPHQRTRAVRAQLNALGWLLLRYRASLRRPGGVRVMYLCPGHIAWRPRRGFARPVDG